MTAKIEQKPAGKGMDTKEKTSQASILRVKKAAKLAKAKKKKKTVKKTAKKSLLLTKIELTEKEEHFCREYVCDAGLNATRAYQNAFKNVTYESARVLASKLFARVNVKARIQELKEDRAKRLEITPERILAELAKLAFYDPRKFFDDDGRLIPLCEMDADQAAVIGGIETFHKVTGDDKDGLCITTKIKLPDKKAALEKLGQNHNLWKEVGSKDNPLVINRVELVAL
jgi:phage terminase small subunit